MLSLSLLWPKHGRLWLSASRWCSTGQSSGAQQSPRQVGQKSAQPSAVLPVCLEPLTSRSIRFNGGPFGGASLPASRLQSTGKSRRTNKQTMAATWRPLSMVFAPRRMQRIHSSGQISQFNPQRAAAVFWARRRDLVALQNVAPECQLARNNNNNNNNTAPTLCLSAPFGQPSSQSCKLCAEWPTAWPVCLCLGLLVAPNEDDDQHSSGINYWRPQFGELPIYDSLQLITRRQAPQFDSLPTRKAFPK